MKNHNPILFIFIITILIVLPIILILIQNTIKTIEIDPAIQIILEIIIAALLLIELIHEIHQKLKHNH